MSKSIIEVKNISKSFGLDEKPLKVLNDLSLNMQEGETLGLVGASGSGKSTLLHIICGLENPDSGKVIIKDQDITKLDADQ